MASKDIYTSIRVRVSTVKVLKKVLLVPTETYEHAILRLVAEHKKALKD